MSATSPDPLATNPDPLLAVDAAANYLDTSTTTVRRLIARGELQGTYIGRILRVRVSHLEDYLTAASTGGR